MFSRNCGGVNEVSSHILQEYSVSYPMTSAMYADDLAIPFIMLSFSAIESLTKCIHEMVHEHMGPQEYRDELKSPFHAECCHAVVAQAAGSSTTQQMRKENV